LSARILGVEDTPALRALLELSLTRAGYRVDLAEEGRSAVELFLAAAYDAVVMDVQMPVMDGLTAVMRMREGEKAGGRAPVPILALTANTEPGDLRKCLEAGFTATVRKPFGREDLLKAVAKHLGSAAGGQVRVEADPQFAELIPAFLDSCRGEAAAMESALERGDFQAITEASHKISGAGASYGFQPLSDEGRMIEAAAKAADAAGISAHLGEMRLFLARVRVVYR
jgi:CheY-like chemotaxis protein